MEQSAYGLSLVLVGQTLAYAKSVEDKGRGKVSTAEAMSRIAPYVFRDIKRGR